MISRTGELRRVLKVLAKKEPGRLLLKAAPLKRAL